MSRPWNTPLSSMKGQGSSGSWRKDMGTEKKKKLQEGMDGLEDHIKMEEEMKNGKKVFSLLVGKDNDHEEFVMDLEDDGEIRLNELRLEENKRQDSLDILKQRVKKAEEKAPGSVEHIRLLRRYIDQMDEKIIKGLEANLEVCLRSISTQKKTIEVNKKYIDLLEKLARERTNRIIYLETLNNTLSMKVRKLEAGASAK